MGARTCLSLALALALTGCGPTDRAELTRRVLTLDAIAVEGAQLARGVEQDRTKATFTRVHARTLAEDATHEAEKVADATVEAGLEDERDATVELADRVERALGSLQVSPGEEALGHQAREDLAAAHGDASRLIEALTP